MSATTAEAGHWPASARRDPDYGPLLDRWEAGHHPTGPDFERVRQRCALSPRDSDPVGVYVLREVFAAELSRFLHDNARCYHVDMTRDPFLNAYLGAFRCALVTTMPTLLSRFPIPQAHLRLTLVQRPEADPVGGPRLVEVMRRDRVETGPTRRQLQPPESISRNALTPWALYHRGAATWEVVDDGVRSRPAAASEGECSRHRIAQDGRATGAAEGSINATACSDRGEEP